MGLSINRPSKFDVSFLKLYGYANVVEDCVVTLTSQVGKPISKGALLTAMLYRHRGTLINNHESPSDIIKQ